MESGVDLVQCGVTIDANNVWVNTIDHDGLHKGFSENGYGGFFRQLSSIHLRHKSFIRKS